MNIGGECQLDSSQNAVINNKDEATTSGRVSEAHLGNQMKPKEVNLRKTSPYVYKPMLETAKPAASYPILRTLSA